MSIIKIKNKGKIFQQNNGDGNINTFSGTNESFEEFRELIVTLKDNIDCITQSEMQRMELEDKIQILERQINSVAPDKGIIKHILGQMLTGISSSCIANNLPIILTQISSLLMTLG